MVRRFLFGPSRHEDIMSVARVTEISASSTKSFDDAVRIGVERASKTLKNVSGAWVKDQQVSVQDGKVSEYVVKLKITFVLE
jgi:flavin-binding protein dodecin